MNFVFCDIQSENRLLTTYLAYAAVVTVMRTSLDCISHTEYRSGIVVIKLRQ